MIPFVEVVVVLLPRDFNTLVLKSDHQPLAVFVAGRVEVVLFESFVVGERILFVRGVVTVVVLGGKRRIDDESVTLVYAICIIIIIIIIIIIVIRSII